MELKKLQLSLNQLKLQQSIDNTLRKPVVLSEVQQKSARSNIEQSFSDSSLKNSEQQEVNDLFAMLPYDRSFQLKNDASVKSGALDKFDVSFFNTYDSRDSTATPLPSIAHLLDEINSSSMENKQTATTYSSLGALWSVDNPTARKQLIQEAKQRRHINYMMRHPEQKIKKNRQ